jgi:hypothetical protein
MKVANEKYMPCRTVVINVFLLLIWPAILKKNVFPFPLTLDKILGDYHFFIDQTISNGAANPSFLLITHQYFGATNQIAQIYWCC